MEDEYGHSRVTTAWILRPAGGLVEGSSSWIGIVVDMVIIIEDGSWFVHCSRYFKACRRHSFQESHLQLREEAKLLTRRKRKEKRKGRPDSHFLSESAQQQLSHAQASISSPSKVIAEKGSLALRKIKQEARAPSALAHNKTSLLAALASFSSSSFHTASFLDSAYYLQNFPVACKVIL